MEIIIADDHALIIEGIKNVIIRKYPRYNVAGAINKEELLGLLEKKHFDLLFQDVKFKHADAREFINEIRENYPHLKIVIISSFSDVHAVETLLKQGVNGYLLKTDTNNGICKAIEAVQNDKTYVSPELRHLLTSTAKSKKLKNIFLTAREKEVLKEILKGKTTKEIAAEIFLSEKTIENYRSNLFLKFDVKNMAGLVKKAILEGYL